MSNAKKSYSDLGARAPTNWDSVVLLSLIEIADKVINKSRGTPANRQPKIADSHAIRNRAAGNVRWRQPKASRHRIEHGGQTGILPRCDLKTSWRLRSTSNGCPIR